VGVERRFSSVSALETVVLSDTIQSIEQNGGIHQKHRWESSAGSVHSCLQFGRADGSRLTHNCMASKQFDARGDGCSSSAWLSHYCRVGSSGSSPKRFLNNRGQTHAAEKRQGSGQVMRPSSAIGPRASTASCDSRNRSSLLRARYRYPEPCSLAPAALSLRSLRLLRRRWRTEQVR